MNELKQLDFKSKNFTANGQEYIILNEVPLSRYIEYQKEVPKLTYGVTFPEMFKNLKTAFDLLNKMKFAESSVVIHNIMNGIAEVENENRHDAALRICTLFIVRKDENLGEYDKSLSEAKIKDWSAEGYGIIGFFHLALISIEGFRQTFSEFILKNNQN